MTTALTLFGRKVYDAEYVGQEPQMIVDSAAEYKAAVDAAQIVYQANLVLTRADGMVISPAWTFVRHVEEYVLRRAEASFKNIRD